MLFRECNPKGCGGCIHWCPENRLCVIQDKGTPVVEPLLLKPETVIAGWAMWKQKLAGVTPSKYTKEINGKPVDIYDILKAYNVTNPALQHLIKKALCAGLRGHKDRLTDMREILESAKRALELEDTDVPTPTS